ncbi:acid phosphatase [Sphingobium tyrosinilyticum]
MIDRSSQDLGAATLEVKKHYRRPRPFMVNGKTTCTPTWERALRHDGSYPSGHSAIGFGVSLILAEVFPDRAAQIVARGRAFGDSRRICNVHWLSDIEEGRAMAAATVMRLNADQAFQADLKAALAEVASISNQSTVTGPDCAEESRILSQASGAK